MKTKNIEELITILETRNLDSISYKDSEIEISISKKGLVQAHSPQVIEAAPIVTKNAIVSPLVGVYYGRPSPDEAPFVTLGQSIAVGDVVCIIEAMKVMSEIKSDKAGIVSEILLKDGAPVAFDQALLVIK